jgi:UPF0755 protein
MGNDHGPRSRLKIWLVVWALLIAFGAGYTAYDVLVRYPAAEGPGDGSPVEVEVPRGAGPVIISKLLHEEGLISSPGRFRLWIRLSGRLSGVRAGQFVVTDDMSPRRILDALSGTAAYRGNRVTIPEGFDLDRISDALEAAGVVSEESFFLAAWDTELLEELGIPGKTPEGYLFPDTYFFEPDSDPREVVRRMHANFESKILDLGIDGGRLDDVVTLASIVQDEARVQDEMPVIAGVYANRLDAARFPSGLLQADPTVAYGCIGGIRPEPVAPSCEGFSGKLTRAHLEDADNSYNTYRHPGLPPGPICSPGMAALEAAATPKEVPFLFFVAGLLGWHRFASTLADHNANVELYKKGR